MSEEIGLIRTKIDNFKFMLKYIVNNDLIDDVVDHLSESGQTELLISASFVTEIQKFLSEREISDKASIRIVASAHKIIMPGDDLF